MVPSCPIHNKPLSTMKTKYGDRHNCVVSGCDVVLWGGSTSTPADKETRQARMKCHQAFDPLWKGAPKVFKDRKAAYRWVQKTMNLSDSEAHIGRMNEQQCIMLLAKIESMKEGLDEYLQKLQKKEELRQQIVHTLNA